MIWVIGCTGMLGTEVCRTLKENKIEYTGTDHSVDITDFFALNQFAEKNKIDFIINCAAYTAVDQAEDESEKAFKINAEGPRNISRLSKKIGAVLLHISTDYVFDGKADFPIAEDAAVNPTSVYGKSKAEGEKAIFEETDSFYILRTAWLYGFDGKNFVYTMIRAMTCHESIKVVNDQRGTPTFCQTLADVIVKIYEAKLQKKPIPFGIYHVTDEGETTWFEFAKEIKRQALDKGVLTNRNCAVNPCTTEEYPTKAKRPAYSVLSKEKIQHALNIQIPDWTKCLFAFITSPLFDRAKIG